MKKLARIAAVLLVVALGYTGIVIANNRIARGLERALLDAPLPPQTEILDSLWVAGKMEGNGNGMQYFGELLVRSELDEEALKAHYSVLETEQSDLQVFRQTSPVVFEYSGVRFDRFEESGDCYCVQLARYTAVGFEKTVWEGLLNIDTRGH